LVGPQESLLNHFFCVVLVSRHAVRQPVKIPAVPLDEHAIGVTIARERALHGDGVAINGALDAILHPIH
jgi:hypothetical protein